MASLDYNLKNASFSLQNPAEHTKPQVTTNFYKAIDTEKETTD